MSKKDKTSRINKGKNQSKFKEQEQKMKNRGTV